MENFNYYLLGKKQKEQHLNVFYIVHVFFLFKVA